MEFDYRALKNGVSRAVVLRAQINLGFFLLEIHEQLQIGRSENGIFVCESVVAFVLK